MASVINPDFMNYLQQVSQGVIPTTPNVLSQAQIPNPSNPIGDFMNYLQKTNQLSTPTPAMGNTPVMPSGPTITASDVQDNLNLAHALANSANQSQALQFQRAKQNTILEPEQPQPFNFMDFLGKIAEATKPVTDYAGKQLSLVNQDTGGATDLMNALRIHTAGYAPEASKPLEAMVTQANEKQKVKNELLKDLLLKQMFTPEMQAKIQLENTPDSVAAWNATRTPTNPYGDQTKLIKRESPSTATDKMYVDPSTKLPFLGRPGADGKIMNVDTQKIVPGSVEYKPPKEGIPKDKAFFFGKSNSQVLYAEPTPEQLNNPSLKNRIIQAEDGPVIQLKQINANDKNIQTLNAWNGLITTIDDAVSLVNQYGINPDMILTDKGLLTKLAKDNNFMVAYQKLGRAFQEYRTAKTGAQASDKELARLKPLMPTLEEKNIGVFLRNIGELEKEAKKSNQRIVNAYENLGYDTNGLSNMLIEPRNITNSGKGDPLGLGI